MVLVNQHSNNSNFQVEFFFLKQHIQGGSRILDLGVHNPLSQLMQQQGYKVINTNGEDLDEDQSSLTDSKVEVVTAFEILEHLLSPYQVLKSIKAEKEKDTLLWALGELTKPYNSSAALFSWVPTWGVNDVTARPSYFCSEFAAGAQVERHLG